MDNFDNEIDQLLDDFDLKPITKGLGFHHSLQEKKQVKINLKQQQKALKNELETRISQLETSHPESDKPLNMGELAPFYSNQPKIQEESKEVLNIGNNNVQKAQASLTSRLGAWLIDFFIVTSAMLLTIAAIIYLSGYSMAIVRNIEPLDNIVLSFSSIYLMFYFFYFSFFDKTKFSTPGKNFLNILVISDNKNITLMQTASRCFLSLSSIILLGLPLILKLHDRLTNTQVVKKNV